MFASGLVAGTFAPPHAGHHFLIDMARARCAALTVALYVEPRAPIAVELRARWLRETHPDVEVRIVSVALGARQAERAAAIAAVLGAPPDALFTADEAGAAFAAALGCTHVAIDPDHQTLPVSAAAIRADPLAHLAAVAPNVRAYFVRRVCLIGSESTGKTTLCERLAERFGAPWVGEYGREYTLAKLRTANADRWEPAEFVHIAREQQRREDEAARRANGLLICDTDAFATEIWLERYLGAHTAAGWPSRDRPIDLYLLTDPAVPFVADAIRDGEQYREWMFARFREELERRVFSYAVLAGSYTEREHDAETFVANLMKRPEPARPA